MKSVIANENIKAKSVRVVDGSNSTVMNLNAALNLAYSKDLDLVQVSEQEVPVVKIIDLNKYLYEMKQADKTAKKTQRQKTIQQKEIQFTFSTQENDLSTKAKTAQKFITEGKQVRIVMKMQGRTATNPDILKQNKDSVQKFVSRLGDVEFVQTITIQGNNITCIVKAK